MQKLLNKSFENSISKPVIVDLENVIVKINLHITYLGFILLRLLNEE